MGRWFLGYLAAVLLFTRASGVERYLYKVYGEECLETSIGSREDKLLAGLASEGLRLGTCSEHGFSATASTQSVNVPFSRMPVTFSYKRRSAWKVAALMAESWLAAPFSVFQETKREPVLRRRPHTAAYADATSFKKQLLGYPVWLGVGQPPRRERYDRDNVNAGGVIAGIRDRIASVFQRGGTANETKTDSRKTQKINPKVHNEQMKKIQSADGFISALDQSGGSTPRTLQEYGIPPSEYADNGEEEMYQKVHEMRTRIMTNSKYTGDRILGAILFEQTMDREVKGMGTAKYLWEKKRIVPFLKIDKGMVEIDNGVTLMKPNPGLDELLDKAISKGIFGTKMRSVIKSMNKQGIQNIVDQQLDIARQICARGLVPIVEPEVDINAKDKAEIEDFLLDTLMKGLTKMRPDEKVILKLTLPDKVNLYLPLMGITNVVRVVALSGGYDRKKSCEMLSQQTGMVGSFSRAFAEGFNVADTAEQFTKKMDESCKMIADASAQPSRREYQMTKIREQPGFISALDQSGGSTPAALKFYGIEESEYSGEKEMFDKVHAMRSRFMMSPKYHGGRVIGAILFEATMDRKVDGMPTAQYLWDVKRVVPFLKIDKGLEKEKNGVQMLKDMPGLDKLLEKARKNHIFGTKMRSVIKDANEEGIKALVEQQFEIGVRIIKAGMTPIIEPEVDINSPHKEQCEELLLKYLIESLDKLKDEKVIIKLTLPSKENLYKPLIEHPSTIRIVALSGGYSHDQAIKLLAKNNGMIASFSRSFAEGLSAKQSEEDFNQAMDKSCEDIYEASRT